MHDPENAAVYLGGPNSVWSGFKNIQVCETVETNCSSTGTRETPGTLPRQFSDLHPSSSKGPCTLVRFFTKKPLPEDFDLDQVLSISGVTINEVLNIVEHKDRGSYELVVATSYLHLLSEKFHDFQLVVDYNPFEPAEDDIRIHGICEAKYRARANSLNNAVNAIRNGWGCEPAECYRNATRKAGLRTTLERALLNWDIQHSTDKVLKRFTDNLLLLSLNLSKYYDTPSALDLYARDPDDWLQPFQNSHIDLSELSMAADSPIREQSLQTTSIFRSLLEFSDGLVDCGQHTFNFDYTISQNAFLCARLLGVPCECQFGRFDPREMQGALSKSKLFMGVPIPTVPDTLKWSLDMMASVPVGFPDNYMYLPSQLLCGFGARQVTQLCVYFTHIYRRFPSLPNPKSNILLLLSWSSTYHGQTLEVLSDWVKSEESSQVYQRLIEDLWLQQTPEKFTLTLAALLCRERLLPYAPDNTTQPIGGSYLADLDDILNGLAVSNRRTVFEQMILSLLRVLGTLEDSQDLLLFLAEVLDKGPSLLTPLDGVSDQYCAGKIHGYTHNRAFEEARAGLLKSVEAMFNRDMNTDAEWTVIPISPLKMVRAL